MREISDKLDASAPWNFFKFLICIDMHKKQYLSLAGAVLISYSTVVKFWRWSTHFIFFETF